MMTFFFLVILMLLTSTYHKLPCDVDVNVYLSMQDEKQRCAFCAESRIRHKYRSTCIRTDENKMLHRGKGEQTKQ